MKRVAVATTLATLLVAVFASGSAGGHVGRKFYGIVQNTALNGGDFARMGKARVGTLRFLVLWPFIQGSQGGSFNWAAVDSEVAAAAARRISVLPTLLGTPGFVAGGSCGRLCSIHIHLRSKRQKREWKSFVRAAVARYGRHGTFWKERGSLPYKPITHWQIWNEQNNPNERNSPKLYAKLLKLSDKAASSADRKAKLITGGMFGNPPGKSRTATAWGYLRALYKHHAGKHIDGVALHPYSPNLAGLKFQVKKIRRVLKSRHHGRTKTFITEIGWGSSKKRYPGTGSRGQVFNVGARKQKKKLSQSFGLLTRHRKRWRIGGVEWFTWKDPVPVPGYCAFCYSSGLYHKDGTTPKPALKAYKRFTKKTTKRG